MSKLIITAWDGIGNVHELGISLISIKGNQRIFSRLPSMNGKWVDTPGKVNEAEVKRSYIKVHNINS